VRLLLDTHAFLWFLLDDPHLSATAQAVIVDPLNNIERGFPWPETPSQ
jgi:PIN domain nuclease of toxin-antitoxin system